MCDMEWLKSVGLNEKQVRLYLHLLEMGSLAASELARDLREQRTNVYLLTDSLMRKGLIEKDESQPVTHFKATDPKNVEKLFKLQETQLTSSAEQMKRTMPELLGMYHLNTAQDGMAYFEGLKGYASTLEDAIKAGNEVCVFGGSNIKASRSDAWDVLLNKLQKRVLAKIQTRLIFEEAIRHHTDTSVHEVDPSRRYMQVKFWGKSLFDGEVAVYGSTVVLTSYDEKLVSLVIKNQGLATTIQAIFDTAWDSCQ